MVDMAIHQILPAAMHYTRDLCSTVSGKQAIGASCRAESSLIRQLSEASDALYDAIEALKAALKAVPADAAQASGYYHDAVIPCMHDLRAHADTLEMLTDKTYWPYPTYSDLLFY